MGEKVYCNARREDGTKYNIGRTPIGGQGYSVGALRPQESYYGIQ